MSLILATHGHLDHINRADAWRDATSAPLAIHPADEGCLTDARQNLSDQISQPFVCRPAEQLLSDGQSCGSTRIAWLEVIAYAWPYARLLLLSSLGIRPGGRLFSGDVLFADSIGRTDLDGGDTQRWSDHCSSCANWVLLYL